MKSEAKFLDWKKPLLETVADFFIENHSNNGILEMKHVVAALPATRAKDRLEEILAEKMNGKPWYPPQFITFGHLPEEFYIQERKIADDLMQIFTWVEVLEKIPEELRNSLPPLPENSGIEGRYQLGKIFAQLYKKLSADGKTLTENGFVFPRVVQYCKDKGLIKEKERWEQFAQLEETYLDALYAKGFWDLQSARINAVSPRLELKEKIEKERKKISERFKKEGKIFYLVGVSDMNKSQKDILELFREFVRPIVFAPESERSKFDDFGCVKPDVWKDETITLTDEQIAVVAGPDQEADEIMKTLAAFEEIAAEQIIIGRPDEKIIPFIENRFARAGINCRNSNGKSIRQTGIYRFLETWEQFLRKPDDGREQTGYEVFAELIRHPDFHSILNKRSITDKSNFITALDEYQNAHLPDVVSAEWLPDVLAGDRKKNAGEYTPPDIRLKDAWDDVLKLLEMNEPDNFKRLSTVLTNMYDGIKPFNEDSAKEFAVVKNTLQKVKDAAGEIAEDAALLNLQLNFPQFLKLVLLQLANSRIPEPQKEDAVDLLGWLDIPLDDAKHVIITGMNDGNVPSYESGDQFLPEKMCAELGLLDNNRRIARDVFALKIILASKETVKLIAARRNTEGNPQNPSRLFFHDNNNEVVCKRLANYFDEDELKKMQRIPPISFSGEKAERQKEHRFYLPELPQTEIKYVSVTAFEKYEACPFRFYLGNVLGLKHLVDDEEELNAGVFGNLMHRTLDIFGNDLSIRDSKDAEEIKKFILKEFGNLSKTQYGSNPKPAVQIQFESMQKRLARFADFQAKRAAEGWRIIKTEFGCGKNDKVAIYENENPLYLKGRIDRLDYNEEEGYAVLDYKSSDKIKTPDTVHRKGKQNEKRWVSYQLPLYHFILRNTDKFADKPDYLPVPVDSNIKLGYVLLPKDDDVKAEYAEWSANDIEEAINECRKIAEKIRAGEWNIKESPQYDDFAEFARLKPKK